MPSLFCFIPEHSVEFARSDLSGKFELWHGFFIESFVDELATRIRAQDASGALFATSLHLPLILGAEKSGWGTPLPSGQGRGIAITECFGTIVAHVAEVEITNDGHVMAPRGTVAFAAC